MNIVDRIEDGIAVIETGENTYIKIPVGDLPEDVREGSVLVLKNGVYVLDIQQEEMRRKKLFELQKQIFNKGGNK